jgi:hypothetical protein
VTLAPGGLLSVVLDVATGLTPPPGIQEDRALRLFTLSLCAQGIDLGGGGRRCFPLAVRNLRPVDGTSLRYRVEAPVPVWVAPWIYDLTLRFPGGQLATPQAVIVRDAAAREFDLSPVAERTSKGVSLPAGGSTAPPGSLVRVHVGPAGLALSGASFVGYPLPDVARGFAPGFVALVQRAGTGPVSMTKRQGAVPSALIFRSGPAYAGSPVTLRADGAPPGSRVFWWLDPARGASGGEVTTVFLLRGQAPLQLLLIAPDGGVSRRDAVLPIWQRRAFGCAVGPAARARGGSASLANCLILLLGWAWRRRRCRGGARFAIGAARAGRRAPATAWQKKGLGGRG